MNSGTNELGTGGVWWWLWCCTRPYRGTGRGPCGLYLDYTTQNILVKGIKTRREE